MDLDVRPMAQFEIHSLFGGDINWYTPTNTAMWMGLAILAAVLLLVVGSRGRAMIPSRTQSISEMMYGFTHSMIEDITGKEGLKFFPQIMTLFVFLLATNIIGLWPYSFTVTSHVAVTGVLALVVFLSVTVLGFVRNGTKFLKVFWITEAPLVLRPILAFIEIISYFVRPVSHSIRLAGNMMAGHSVIVVFASFAVFFVGTGGATGLAAIAPTFAIAAVYALEVLVVVIQAYVFTILTCVYLNDALHPGH